MDERKDQMFCSRYQEILCPITQPSNYKQYRLEASTATGDTLVLGDVLFFDTNLNANWEDFKYPEIDYEVIDPETKGQPFMRGLSRIRTNTYVIMLVRLPKFFSIRLKIR